jgi:membrane-associated protease RseP (regulator of RpoE activity)
MNIAKVAACLVVLSGTLATAAVLPIGDDVQGDAEPQASTPPAKAKTRAVLMGGSRLGISIRDVNEEDVKTTRLASQSGVVVEEVFEESAAEEGGLRKGDVIVEFDGERVRSARQLTRLVQETADARKVPAVVVRDGQRVTLTLTPREGAGFFEDLRGLADWGRGVRVEVPRVPAQPRARPTPPSVFRFDDWVSPGGRRLGVTVDDLSPQLAEYFGTKDGVLVTSVQDNSAAAKAGIRAGDVITRINGTTVDDPADVRRRLQSLDEGAEFTIDVVREKKPQTLKGKLEPSRRERAYRSIV